MSPTTAPPRSEGPVQFSAPGKFFILGEYAVLFGAPAWVSTVGPRFTLSIAPPGEAKDTFHPESPAGRLVRYFSEKGIAPVQTRFHDPLRGAGGIGASTAQFALLLQAYWHVLGQARAASQDSQKTAWELYRELTASEPLPPSGADLAAQWLGGIVRFCSSPPSCIRMNDSPAFPFPTPRLLFFSATLQQNRKVATHEHLAQIADFQRHHAPLLARLDEILARAEQALSAGNDPAFGRCLTDYAIALAADGLELPATRDDREFLASLPGVLGIKGTGALQADGMVLLLDSQSANPQEIVRKAKDRGLSWLNDGLGNQPGVLCQF